MAVVNALQCPNCGAPVRATYASCRSCGVGLSFNYAELFGVQDYQIIGRDAILDGTLLALVDQEAKKHKIEVVPALSGDRVVVYVRDPLTNSLFRGGHIEASEESYLLRGDSGNWYIYPQVKLGQNGRIYYLSDADTLETRRFIEGEDQLVDIPEIQQWAKDCVTAAERKSKVSSPSPKRRFNLLNPATWFG